MPHLSPLNWILMLFMMITMIMIMNSNLWWKPKTKFFMPMNTLSSSSQTWNW